jgi:hypothetical protein
MFSLNAQDDQPCRGSDLRTSTKCLRVSRCDDAKSRITLEQLEGMFENMRTRAKWDTEGDLLWGYFFTDPDPKKLEKVRDRLTRAGYRFVSLRETDDKSTYFLHVEKVERHTPETLHLRNGEFYKLTEEFGLESYDGMDAGPVEGKRP